MDDRVEQGPENPDLLKARKLASSIGTEAKRFEPNTNLPRERLEELRDYAGALGELLVKNPSREIAEEAARAMGVTQHIRKTPQGEIYHEVPPGTNLIPLFDKLVYEKNTFYPNQAYGLLLPVILGMNTDSSNLFLENVLRSKDSSIRHVHTAIGMYLRSNTRDPIGLALGNARDDISTQRLTAIRDRYHH